MPLSRRRKRKKTGKPVKSNPGTFIKVDPEKESEVTLQDLINMVAYQDYQDKGLINAQGKITQVAGDLTVIENGEARVIPASEYKLAEDFGMQIPDTVPVYYGEGEDRKQVGTASPIPGDDSALSVQIAEDYKWITGEILPVSIDFGSIQTGTITAGTIKGITDEQENM